MLTTKGQSTAAKIADQIYVFKSIDEPYTYNVSTYMGMILAVTKENPQQILNTIHSLKVPEEFVNYEAYSFVIPDQFMQICPMLDIKKSELFGPHLELRAFSQGHARHAKFVNRWDKELIISIGTENKYFGDPKSRWDLSLPAGFNYAGVMALTYYLVGKIQENKPQYYRQNIEKYCLDYGPKAYGSDKQFDVIVPGSER